MPLAKEQFPFSFQPMEFLQGILISTGTVIFLLLVCIVIEHIAVIERYTLRQRVPGFMMNIVGSTLAIGLAWPLQKLWGAMGLAPAVIVPLWKWLEPLGLFGYVIQFLLLITIADFLAYWRHRAEHRWFWTIHVVHHAPTELHAANDIGHPVQVLFSLLFITIPMSLIFIDGPTTPFAVGALVSFLSVYVHSPIDFHFGPLRKVIVDNRFHRIHHSLEPHHIDRNFGICLSLWDRLFGTACDPNPDEWPRVGVANVPPPHTLKDYLTLPIQLFRR